MTCFNWTYEYIDHFMDIPRVKEIMDYQKRNPPLHQMVAAYLGINSESTKSDKKPETKEEQKQETEQMINFLSGAGAKLAPRIKPRMM